MGLPGPVAVVSVHASPVGPPGRAANGGMNLALQALCRGLAERGVPSDVFTRRDAPELPSEELIAPGARLVRLPAGPPRALDPGEVAATLPAFARALTEHARSERRRYAVVHSHYWLSGVVAASLDWDAPWLHSFHTLARTKERAGLPADPVRAVAEQRLVRAAERIVAGSAAEAADLRTLYGADPGSICVVRPGVDLEVFSPRDTRALRAAHGLEGRRVIAFAGRLEPLKGGDLLLESLAELARDPELDDVVLCVAGEDSFDGARVDEGGERERLRRLAAELGVAGRVRFLGALPQAELAQWLALADVCAVPSRTESFGLVALEAQACATPVVGADVGGLREIVADAVTGYLVPRRAEAFAGRLAAVLRDPGLAGSLGAAARERAAPLSWRGSTDRLLALYTAMLDPERRADPCGFAA